MTEIQSAVQRIDMVKGIDVKEYSGTYYFPTYAEARTALENRMAMLNPQRVALVDVDDTLSPFAEFAMGQMNSELKIDPNSDAPHLKDLRRGKTGRFYEIPQYTKATQERGKEFSSFFEQAVRHDEQLHYRLPPRRNALRFLREMESQKVFVGGYISGRSDALTQLTAQWLSAYSFPEAPVFCMNADPANPSLDKPNFIKTLLKSIPNAKKVRWYLLDDDVPTALSIKNDEELSNLVDPVVPIIGRNNDQKNISLLAEANILYGSYETNLSHAFISKIEKLRK